jgi:hypothetical protein
MGTSSPSPSPSPTPTPEPVPAPTLEPSPSSDVTAPITVQQGADDAWHNTNVTVTFLASDEDSGVDYTEYSVNGGPWTKGASVTIAPPKKTAVAAIHVIEYRSVDKAGNVEAANTAYVKLDTKKPVTTSNATSTTHVGSFTLNLTAIDADAGVAATYLSLDGGAYRLATSVTITGSGRHGVRFYSTDNAENVEDVKSATVRIK